MSYFLAFLGFAALIILHEAGHFTAAKLVGMRVERFSLFFGPMFLKRRRGETEYGIGVIPLGGYVKITGMNPNEEIPPEVLPRAYFNQPVWKRIVVILAGPAVNLLIAFILLAGIYLSEGREVTHDGQPVAANTVAAGSIEQPAAKYLKPGDAIVAIDGVRKPAVDRITTLISQHRCAGTPTRDCQAKTPVSITVRRAGQLKTFSVYPRYDAGVKRMRVGFAFNVLIAPVSVWGASGLSISKLWSLTEKTVSTVGRIFEPKERKQLHSVVGGFTVTSNAIAFSATDALATLALISLSLGVVNLFPFLPLDGGHVFWAVAEKVRGKRISFDVIERAGVVGFVLILLVFVIGLSNDISTLTGAGFNAR